MNRLKRIMLVDDNRHTNFYNKIILGQIMDIEDFVECRNGNDALAYFENEKQSVDLIFLDINMPLMNGWEFLEEYKKLNIDITKTPIIMLTSSPNPDDEIRAKSFSAIKKYICKPLTPRTINETMSLIS